VTVVLRHGLHLRTAHALGIDDERTGIAARALVREDVDEVDRGHRGAFQEERREQGSLVKIPRGRASVSH